MVTKITFEYRTQRGEQDSHGPTRSDPAFSFFSATYSVTTQSCDQTPAQLSLPLTRTYVPTLIAYPCDFLSRFLVSRQHYHSARPGGGMA